MQLYYLEHDNADLAANTQADVWLAVAATREFFTGVHSRDGAS
jgi:hypothetical protein